MRRSSRHAQNGEPLQVQGIGELPDVLGPVQQGAARLWVGETDAGAVHGDAADPPILQEGVGDSVSLPGVGQAVEFKDRRAGKVTPFEVGKRPSIPQSKNRLAGPLFRTVAHQGTPFLTIRLVDPGLLPPPGLQRGQEASGS